jgi:S1-C subfamily serine protease
MTTLITCKDGRKTIGTGTGFFFKDSEELFLITNRHIVINPRENFFPDKITIKLNKHDSLEQHDELDLSLYDKKDKLEWIELSEEIDIVAIKLDLKENYLITPLTKSNFAPENTVIGPGRQLLVIGYPQGFYDEVFNLPVV